MEKKLYRSRENKVISGVCGGIAEYFDVDATLIRLLWAVTVLLGGTGIIAYILCIIIIPEAPLKKTEEEVVTLDDDGDVIVESGGEETAMDKNENKNKNGGYVVGLMFIAIGLMFIARRIFWWLNIDFAWDLFWPALLVLFGMYLIVKKRG
jgi:phage shock protein PspC (stress-responsive transcriptional regulator)